MTLIPIYRPYVFLRCKKCNRKTEHVLIGISAIKEAIEEDFECQECGQVRKIYEIAIPAEPENPAIQELERKIEAKRKLVKQLEARRRNLEKKLGNHKREST